jgi:cobalt-zinc-cadmium efflux system membrane fusion protein
MRLNVLGWRDVLRGFSTLLIWLSFVAIAYWGHATHWTFVSSEHHSAEHEAEGHEDAVAVTDASVTSPSARDTGHSTDATNSHPVTDTAAGATEPVSSSNQGIVSWNDAGELERSGIQWTRVRQAEITETVPALATVTYDGRKYAQLATRAEGHVFQVFARPGQKIAKGEVLALIDSQLVGEAKSEYLQAMARVRFTAQTLEQLSNAGAGAVPRVRLLAAESEARDAKLQAFLAQQKLFNLGIPIDDDLSVDRSPDELSERLRYAGIDPSVIHSLPEPPGTANLIAIVAPFSGIVLEQHAVIGEVVSPSEFQFVIADTSTVWLRLSIRREQATRLAVGQPVEFRAIGVPKPVQTRLAWISSEIDAESRTVQAGCEVENFFLETDGEPRLGEYALRANQFGNATIEIARHDQALLVPELSVQTMPDMTNIVFAKLRNRFAFESRSVILGVKKDGWVQILSGVSPEDEVVSQQSFILKSELMRSTLVGG